MNFTPRVLYSFLIIEQPPAILPPGSTMVKDFSFSVFCYYCKICICGEVALCL